MVFDEYSLNIIKQTFFRRYSLSLIEFDQRLIKNKTRTYIWRPSETLWKKIENIVNKHLVYFMIDSVYKNCYEQEQKS